MNAVPHSTGSMLALYLDEQTAAALALPGGQDPADLHVTVAYTGKAADVDWWRLRHAAETVADRKPIAATISGHARFTGGEDGDVIVALVDSPDLERLRRDAVDALTAQGVALPSGHGYTAHVSLAYVDPGAPSPITRLAPVPLTFPALTVKHGDDRDDLPFTTAEASLPVLLRLAYAQGWAASGGPLTERVRAGCTAAVQTGLRHADDPAVVEVTLHLGHLEGIWAAVYERRERLHATNETAILKAWRGLGLAAHTDLIVKAARKLAGLTEATDADGDRLAQLVLRLIAADAAGNADLADAVKVALVASEAEGRAAGAGLLAAERGDTAFSLDVAAEDAYKALAAAPDLIGASEVDAWLTRTLGDAASEVGQKLSSLTRAGASYEDMTAAAGGILNGTSVRSVRTAVDLLTSRALSQGSLDLYRAEGVTHVDFLTAGDGRACPQCAALEAKNPYRVGNAPVPGIHPHCRCGVAPVLDPQAASALASALTGQAALQATADDIAAAERAGEDVARVRLSGGVSAETSLVTLPDGRTAVYKRAPEWGDPDAPKTQADAEQLGSKLAQALGVSTPAVVPAGADAVWMEYIPGRTAGELLDLGSAQAKTEYGKLLAGPQGKLMGLLDVLIGNADRNAGNLIVSSGVLVGIDHGFAFELLERAASPDALGGTLDGRPAGHYVGRDGDHNAWIDNPLTAEDVERVRRSLENLRPAFRDLGREDWLDRSLGMLNELGEHAAGKESIFDE